MIKLEVTRDGMKKRYELQFFQGQATWFMFLDDKVFEDPRMFSSWMKSLVQELQVKSK